VIHIQDQIYVLPPVTALDCDSQQQFPQIHGLFVDIQALNEMLDVSSDLLEEVLSDLEDYLCEILGALASLPLREIDGIGFPEQVFDKFDVLNAV